MEEKALNLSREKDQLLKERDSAIQEAQLWRSELAKARERAVILEGAVVRAEEKVRVTEADAEARIKEAIEKESAAAQEKQELLSYINALQDQLKRFISILSFFFHKIVRTCLSFLFTFPKSFEDSLASDFCHDVS